MILFIEHKATVKIEQLIDFNKPILCESRWIKLQIKDIYTSLPLVWDSSKKTLERRIDLVRDDFYYNEKTNLFEKTFVYENPITGRDNCIKVYAKEEDFTEGPVRAIDWKGSIYVVDKKDIQSLPQPESSQPEPKEWDSHKDVEVIIFFFLAVFVIVASIVGIAIL